MKILTLFLLTITFTFGIYALPASNFVPNEIIDNPNKGFFNSANDTANLKYLPQHESSKIIKKQLEEEKPTVAIEALYFIPYKNGQSSIEQALLKSYNTLRALQTLKGVQYYSVSKKKMRELYSYSSIIKSQNDESEVPDKKETVWKEKEESLFARQIDSSFGDNIYKVNFFCCKDYLIQESTNLTSLAFGIIPAAKPNAVKLRINIIAADDGLLFYVASSANVSMIPFLASRVEQSFSNRAIAIFDWFLANYNK